jgi:8-amino-7-oxononanoate synthase
MMFDFLTKQLAQQKILHRYRQRTLLTFNGTTASIKVAGKGYLNFSSNDYLALNNHPIIIKAMQEGIDKFGLCSTGSSLLTGFSYAHRALEETICQWLNKPKCLLFNSGFAANTGVLQALGEKHCHFYLDKLVHASIIDGALASNAQVKRFLHNDLTQLTAFINKTKQKFNDSDHLIVSEGVFSMDGDQARITELSQLARQHKAMLYLDDAHSIGVIGEQGQGSCSDAAVDIVMATFGKAVATSGAFVACNDDLFDYLVNFSRHYIYSTSMSPALAWATKASIELLQKECWRRDKIVELSALFSEKLADDIELLPTQSSIHAIVIGSEEKTLKMSAMLKEQGFWLSAIRPPTVIANKSRLRVTLTCAHNKSDINKLAKALNKAAKNIM